MSSLVVTSGINQGRCHTLGERTRMGRSAENEIVLTDNLVSRNHAEIVRSGIHFIARDLSSKNGIRINGALAAEHRLRYGDVLQVGETTFTFEAASEVKTTRFSDLMVHLESTRGQNLEILEPDAAPPHAPRPLHAPMEGYLGLVEAAGRLVDAPAEDLPAALQRILALLMAQFSAQAGSILLRGRSGDATPLVAVSEDGALRLSREAARIALADGKAVLGPSLNGPGGARPAHSLLVPLTRQQNVFGALHLERLHGDSYRREDLALLSTISRLVGGSVRLAIQLDQLSLSTAPVSPSDPFIGVSHQSDAIRERIRKVAASDSTVLLTGETGSGKELVSRAIHAASTRASRPFVAIDCSAIPASLMESELFGYEQGAFTGADRLKRGKVEMAEGGTLQLDEIGELALELQPKLLRFMEDLYFYRVGGTRPMQADVRIIAATNRNLRQAVSEGRFREDLLFRLNVMPIHLPPLRQRPDDIRPLVEYYAPRLASRLGKPFLGLLDDAWALLEKYTWPGNVRELRHGLERALILSDDGILRPEHFQLSMPDSTLPDPTTDGGHRRGADSDQTPVTQQVAPPSLEEVEGRAIRRALEYANGNRIAAAKILNIHRNTLAKKIKELGIE